MIRCLVVLLLVVFASGAKAADLPQIDCPLVRAFVAEHGKIKALALAIEQGATWRQIREARKCLK